MILKNVAASCIEHPSFRRILNPFEQRRIARRSAVVVPQQNRFVIRVGADDRNPHRRGERQDPIIFQKDHAFLRHFTVQGAVGFAFHCFIGDLVVFAVRIEHTKAYPCGEQALGSVRDDFLCNQPFCRGCFQPLIGAPAVEMATVVERERRAFRLVLSDLVVLVDVADSSAVGHHVAVETEFGKEGIL